MNYGVVTDSQIEAKVSSHDRFVRKIDHRPNVPGPWVYLETGTDLDDVFSPPYLSGFSFAGLPYDYPAFRDGLDGAIEWKGHVDTGSASSGDPLCTLPVRWRPARDVSCLTDIFDGASFQVCRMLIEASNGLVTLFWPAT